MAFNRKDLVSRDDLSPELAEKINQITYFEIVTLTSSNWVLNGNTGKYEYTIYIDAQCYSYSINGVYNTDITPKVTAFLDCIKSSTNLKLVALAPFNGEVELLRIFL